MVPSLHHIALRTIDLPRLTRFYVHALGFRTERSREGAVWLALGGGAVLMLEAALASETLIAAGTLDLLAFRAEANLDALRAQLALHGVTVESETAHTLYFRDPDGRRVGLSNHPLVG